MTKDLPIQCACGAVRGVARDVAPSAGNHVVCYCADCQAFARFLGRDADILDEHGGTEIFQLSQAKLAISAGADRIACMRLSSSGMLRWYASCCNTPIGNTLSTTNLPFIGLITTCLLKSPPGASLDADLGPVLARGSRKSAQGDSTTIPRDGMPLPLLAIRFVRLVLTWRLRRDGRRSEFFNPHSGQAIVTPRVLSDAERAQLR